MLGRTTVRDELVERAEALLSGYRCQRLLKQIDEEFTEALRELGLSLGLQELRLVRSYVRVNVRCVVTQILTQHAGVNPAVLDMSDEDIAADPLLLGDLQAAGLAQHMQITVPDAQHAAG